MTRFFSRNDYLGSRVVALFLAACLLVMGAFAFAAQEKFDYDPLGRLVRVVDELGRVTDYVYDPAGNLLQVVTNGTLTPPSISSVTPTALRRGETQSFIINGAELNGVRLVSSDPDLSLTKLTTTSGQITFDLLASTGAVLGPHVFTFENSAGSATAFVTVNPLLPAILVSPAPLAIPPDGKPHQFIVRLSNSDTLSHTINLATSDATMAIVAPASVTIAAGATEVYANITGLTGGTTDINLTSTTLPSTKAPVFITADFVGLNTSYAKLLGVVLEQSTVPVSTTITPIVSPLLGVVFGGSYIDAITPKAISVGASDVALTLSGADLQAATSISVIPADGITLGALAIAADGKSVTVPVTVAASAATTTRQVVLKNAAGVAYVVAKPGADLLEIAAPGPEIHSIAPIFAKPGDTAVPFVVRGKNFHDFFDLRMSPASGISIGTLPIINADGTELSTTISLSILSATGPRTVILETLGGISSATPSSANTFSVVTTVEPVTTPVASPLLGVVLETTPVPVSTAYGIVSYNLGVALGPVATAASPSDGEIGTTLSLTIQGNELNGVTALNFTPATGLTVSALTIAPDGKSVNANLAIDATALKTVRKIELLAGSATIPFADPAAGEFLVTGPQPVIESITPLYLQAGAAPTLLTVRGKNFDLAQAVKILPADDITISTPPTVDADNKTITVNVSATANAQLGARSVIVTTPAGETSASASVANTLTVTRNLGSTYAPISSALLGVVLESGITPVSTSVGPIVSPNLGVTLETTPLPLSTTYLQPAPNVGVALGPVATGMQPTSGLPGATISLTITGVGLDAVTGVSVYPADGITVGAISASPDGSQLTVSLSLASNAAALVREIRLTQASGTVAFSDASANRFRVAVGLPSIVSITPILASQGSTFTLTIRGTNLHGTSAVQATPDLGLLFDVTPIVNAEGTEVTLGVALSTSADLGSRVIQVVTPGGMSNSVAEPANTFTVYPL